MQKIITLLLLSTIFTTSFAQRAREEDREDDDRQNQEEQYSKRNRGIYNNGGNNQNSTLVVSSYAQNRFTVNIDNNREYQSNDNNGNANTVNIGSLQAGNHTIVINEMRVSIFGRQKPVQIYNSVLFFKPGVETLITVDNNSQVSITERAFNNNGNNNGNGRGHGYGRKKNKYKRYNSDDQGQSYPNNFPSNYPGNYRQISAYDFSMLKQYVQKEAFDDRKISIAKQAASTSYFSTAQVRDLMSAFSFDDGKLDVAKYFYNRTIDRNNYYQLTDVLSFSSNKDELLNYIKRTR